MKHIVGIHFTLLALNICIHAMTSDSCVFNVTGFDQCAFNLVVTQIVDPESDSIRQDFVELILTSNPVPQLWTVATMTRDDIGKTPFLNFSFREVCSANILITTGGCLTPALDTIFGSRSYNPHNIVYIVRGKPANECSPSHFYFGYTLVNSGLVFLDLAEDNLSVKHAVLWCKKCHLENEMINLTFPYQWLVEVQKFSAEVKQGLSEPIVASASLLYSKSFPEADIPRCKHLYKLRSSTQPNQIGCFHRHILIENVAAKLNYSVEYIPTAKMNLNTAIFSGSSLKKPYSGVASLGIVGWTSWQDKISPENMVKQLNRGKITSLFLYCTPSDAVQREKFNFLFWTVAFDTWSWGLMGASVLFITAILRGQWFPVIAILMRQDCRILNGRQKLLIIFILATIIFTYGYEGVISSLLTAQPPVIMYETLKDLLGAGYKIVLSKDINLNAYKVIFDTENITDPKIESFVQNVRALTEDEKIDGLVQLTV